MSRDGTALKGWRITTLGALGKYVNGRAFKSTEWSKTGRPIIRIQDLTGSNNNPNHFAGQAEQRHTVYPGDLLISWSASLGAYLWDGPEAVLNQHIFKVESAINKSFHYHLARATIAALERSSHGSGMVHVTKPAFEDTPVAVPDDLHLQEQLADFIDAVETTKGSAVGHLASAQRTLQKIRQSILVSACSGRLTEDWRASNPNAESIDRALAAIRGRSRRRGRKQQAVDLELPEVPASYRVHSIDEISTVVEYGTSTRADSSAAKGVPILRMGNIQAGELDLSDLKFIERDSEIDGLMLKDGDLLFNRTNSPELVGKSAVFHSDQVMTFASYLIRVIFAPTVAEPDFVNLWINSAWGRRWARLAKTDGVSQSNINGSKLGLLPVPLPPIAEQREIVRRALSLLSAADEIGRQIAQAIVTTQRLDTAITRKALRSELVESGPTQ